MAVCSMGARLGGRSGLNMSGCVWCELLLASLSCPWLGTIFCSYKMSMRERPQRSPRTNLLKHRWCGYYTRSTLPKPSPALEDASARILVLRRRAVPVVSGRHRASPVIVTTAIRIGGIIAARPIVGEGGFDNVLQSSQAHMYVLVGFARSVGFTELRDLASDAL